MNKKVPKFGAFTTGEGEELIDVKTLKTSDWTFSTPYKGTVKGLDGKIQQYPVHPATEEIPLTRLGQDNPIEWAGEVLFSMDDLDDCGQSTFSFRLRAMGDCFYGLLRSYTRVDNVVVRILDTRIFHSFESRKIIREFQHREATYEELAENGFGFSPQWAVDERQSDLVFEYVIVKSVFKDEIRY